MSDMSKSPDQARASALRSVLRELNASDGEIEASACISSDGYNLASVLGENVDADRFSAMCASLLALANRAAQEIQRGDLKMVMIEGMQGVMLLVHAGPDYILAVAAKGGQNMGRIFMESRKQALKLLEVLEKHK